MNHIAIITDTDSSLPVEIAEKFDIQQVPIAIHFDHETFITGADIDDRLLFEKIDRLNKLPSTSAPAPALFINAFQAAFDKGAQSIICICVSKKISSTYSSAIAACEMFPGKDITIIDSQTLCMSEGFMALIAAEAAQRGATKDEIIAEVENAGQRLFTYAVLPTLKYLALGGPCWTFLLPVSPILSISSHCLLQKMAHWHYWKKVRTRSKAVGPFSWN